ncbi:hypothetical protein TNCV_225781 [Trichonephila clavipes]|nr:hypothetical protein TNCV_225781 [Trichonephila clavipes]
MLMVPGRVKVFAEEKQPGVRCDVGERCCLLKVEVGKVHPVVAEEEYSFELEGQCAKLYRRLFGCRRKPSQLGRTQFSQTPPHAEAGAMRRDCLLSTGSNAIGRWKDANVGSLPALRIGSTVAVFHAWGKCPVFSILFIRSLRRFGVDVIILDKEPINKPRLLGYLCG